MALSSLLQYIYHKVLVTILRTILALSGRYRRIASIPRVSRNERGIKIPSRDKGRYILADIYYPDTAANAPLPALVNWHGSGFIVPLFGSDALFCSRLARDVGIIVIDADYRKAPETPFPGPVNDVEDVLLWVASQKQRFNADRIAVSGFSAGGNLALVAATKLRKKLADVISIPAVLALYPLIDLAAAPETKKVPQPVTPFPLWRLRLFNDCYAPDPSTRTDPAVSPYFADPADFPQTVALATCGGDVLRPEVEKLGEKLREDNNSGKTILEYVCEGVRHGFDNGVIVDGSLEYARREELYSFATNVLKGVFKS
ncbi:Alpha/Beta hydrolase protein [Nemania abortiva]|nr:Alpha/Beta hydrolase protein [Nemania abortiva]